MRNYGLRYSASDLSDAYAEEVLNKVNSYNKGVQKANPDLANDIADMIQAYPTMDVEVAAIAAMEGVKADDQLALDLANAMHSLAVKKIQKI